MELSRNVLQDIINRIVFTAQPKKIILFGSYACGEQDKDSDIDLLVIKPAVQSKTREYFEIRKSLKGIRFPFDIIVISLAEYEFYSLKWENSVIAEARQKGKVIYEH